MIIKPKYDMYFTGSRSGKKMRMLRNVLLEIDEDELTAIDKADYEVVNAGQPGAVVPDPPQKSKKK
jgi:hypothetical protein